MPAVETSGLTKEFVTHRRAVPAVSNLTLVVPDGIVFGYLGPNGAGKTTTIRMLTGVLAPTRGEGRVAGEDLRQPDRVKARIGYANQTASVYADLTVLENLRFKAAMFLPPREVARSVDETIARLGLQDYRGHLASQLSGGWRQRLSIGCAIVHGPPVLFLDEPTAGLDPVGRRELWDAIYALTSAGTTVFVTTHYMDEAERCHRLAMIASGNILAEGTPQELRSAVPGEFYDVEAADIGASLRRAKENAEVRDAWIAGSTLRVAARSALHEDTLRSFGSRFRPAQATLEDAFVALAEQGGAR